MRRVAKDKTVEPQKEVENKKEISPKVMDKITVIRDLMDAVEIIDEILLTDGVEEVLKMSKTEKDEMDLYSKGANWMIGNGCRYDLKINKLDSKGGDK
jgi:hypothetical protein